MVPKDLFFARLKKVFSYNNFDTSDHSELKLLALQTEFRSQAISIDVCVLTAMKPRHRPSTDDVCGLTCKCTSQDHTVALADVLNMRWAMRKCRLHCFRSVFSQRISLIS